MALSVLATRGVLTVMLAAMAGPQAAAQSCGSGWNEALVPDRVPILRCEFKASCIKHDACYSTCQNRRDDECTYRRCQAGGDLFSTKSELCETDLSIRQSFFLARQRRQGCDQDFYESMIAQNPGAWACRALAIVYRDAVKWFGSANFLGFEPGKEPTALQQSETEYKQAIADFFTMGSDADFRAFVDLYGDPARRTNLCGRLSFSRDQGLVNPSEADRRSPCP